jgi:hypothetical protein
MVFELAEDFPRSIADASQVFELMFELFEEGATLLLELLFADTISAASCILLSEIFEGGAAFADGSSLCEDGSGKAEDGFVEAEEGSGKVDATPDMPKVNDGICGLSGAPNVNDRFFFVGFCDLRFSALIL